MKRAITLTAFLALAGCPGGGGGAQMAAPAPAPAAGVASQAPKVAPEVLARGKAIYDVQCVTCHGPKGDGEGPAAYLLAPRPRDFTQGSYRLISTSDGKPTDDDLFQTISRGMPGSSMPSWAHLPEGDRRALVAYVKSFGGDRFDGAREPILVPPEPPSDAASVARGRKVYEASCMPCHGSTGKGDGQQAMVDDKEHRIRPRDFTRGTFKGEPSARNIFLRVRAGLPGSPMPASVNVSDADTWDVVHYVQSLVPAGVEARVVQKRRTLEAVRVAAAPRDPKDAAWERVASAEVVLTPLAWRDERVETISVQGVHDGKDLVLRLSWACAMPSERALRPQDFRDACAIELATGPSSGAGKAQGAEGDDVMGYSREPFFGMGHKGAPVEIVQWKADWQRDLVKFGGIAEQYAFAPSDDTGGLPDMFAAREAGNLAAATDRGTAVELAGASGQGTLASAPRPAQKMSGSGAWADGRWSVTIVRPLGRPDECCADLAPGGTRPIAFAVWQGAFQDRNGQKNVSIWHDLVIEK